MKLSNDILKNFDFDKILHQLGSECVCEVSRQKMMALQPYDDPSDMNQRLQIVQQCIDLITFDGTFDLSGLTDLNEIFQKIAIPGSTLNITNVQSLLEFFFLCQKTRRFQSEVDIKRKYPLLFSYFHAIDNYSTLIKKIQSICSSEGVILDTASPRLREIRKRRSRLHEEIRNTVEGFLHNRDIASFLQESTFTLRRGRYVIPFKSEFQNRIDGVVVDYSSSGSTVFIEPKPLLYLNNELEVLMIQEKDEIELILQQFTKDIRPFLDQFHSSYNALIELDIVCAQSRLARKWKASVPKIGEGNLSIKKGRHPLLGEKAVPFSLEFSPDKRIMVISGPNAGGKTVLLKSLALMVYLAHCGLAVPAEKGSFIPFYQHLFVDIGDHQDIEQNLSTFSYRLSIFQESLDSVSPHSLYLIDEMGAGTDPNEGSALAIGMMNYLYQKGVTCIATTHYPLIKNYVSQHSGMMTASMEFDPVLFQPTYRLLIGEIGESYGIKIAEKLGLPLPIITNALHELQKEWIDLNELIISNRQKNQELNRLTQEWQQKVEESTRRHHEVTRLQQELESQKKELIKDFQKNLMEYLKKTRDDISQLVGQLRKEHALNETVYQKLKEEIDQEFQIVQEMNSVLSIPPSETSSVSFQVGEKVIVDLFNKEAEITTIDPTKNEATVIINGRKVVISLKHLIKKTEDEIPSSTIVNFSFHPEGQRVSNQIEIRKLRAEEAREKLEKYFDQVLLAGYKTIYIIHGKGEGILRSITRDFLNENPWVESFRNGLPEEGGLGVTVVTMKE